MRRMQTALAISTTADAVKPLTNNNQTKVKARKHKNQKELAFSTVLISNEHTALIEMQRETLRTEHR